MEQWLALNSEEGPGFPKHRVARVLMREGCSRMKHRVVAEGPFIQLSTDGLPERQVFLGITGSEFILIKQIILESPKPPQTEADPEVADLVLDFVIPLPFLKFFILDDRAKRFIVCTCFGYKRHFEMCQMDINSEELWLTWRHVLSEISGNTGVRYGFLSWRSSYVLDRNDYHTDFEHKLMKFGDVFKGTFSYIHHPNSFHQVRSIGVQTSFTSDGSRNDVTVHKASWDSDSDDSDTSKPENILGAKPDTRLLFLNATFTAALKTNKQVVPDKSSSWTSISSHEDTNHIQMKRKNRNEHLKMMKKKQSRRPNSLNELLDADSESDSDDDLDDAVLEYDKSTPQSIGGSARDNWNKVKQLVLRKGRTGDSLRQVVFRTIRQSNLGPPKDITSMDPKDVSGWLATMSRRLLLTLRPSDMTQYITSKSKRIPKWIAMATEFSHIISKMVAVEILQCQSLFQRISAITLFIEVCTDLLFEQRDFQSLFAVLAGLTSLPVYRLDNTWATLFIDEQTAFRKFIATVRLLSPKGHFISYTQRIRTCTESNTPFIPWLDHYINHYRSNTVHLHDNAGHKGTKKSRTILTSEKHKTSVKTTKPVSVMSTVFSKKPTRAPVLHVTGKTTHCRDTEVLHVSGKTTPSRDTAVLHASGKTTPCRDTEVLHVSGKTRPSRDTAVLHASGKTAPCRDKAVLHTSGKTTPSRDTEVLRASGKTPSRDKAVSHTSGKTTPSRDTEVLRASGKTTSSRDKAVSHTSGKTTPSRDTEVLRASGKTPSRDKAVSHTSGKTTPSRDKAVSHTSGKTTPSRDTLISKSKDSKTSMLKTSKDDCTPLHLKSILKKDGYINRSSLFSTVEKKQKKVQFIMESAAVTDKTNVRNGRFKDFADRTLAAVLKQGTNSASTSHKEGPGAVRFAEGGGDEESSYTNVQKIIKTLGMSTTRKVGTLDHVQSETIATSTEKDVSKEPRARRQSCDDLFEDSDSEDSGWVSSSEELNKEMRDGHGPYGTYHQESKASKNDESVTRRSSVTRSFLESYENPPQRRLSYVPQAIVGQGRRKSLFEENLTTADDTTGDDEVFEQMMRNKLGTMKKRGSIALELLTADEQNVGILNNAYVPGLDGVNESNNSKRGEREEKKKRQFEQVRSVFVPPSVVKKEFGKRHGFSLTKTASIENLCLITEKCSLCGLKRCIYIHDGSQLLQFQKRARKIRSRPRKRISDFMQHKVKVYNKMSDYDILQMSLKIE